MALSLVGNLADLGLGDIFQVVSMSRRSGTLKLSCPPHAGDIVFKGGRVVAGCIDGSPQTLGESLVEAGVIASSQYPFVLLAEQEGTDWQTLFAQFDMSPLLFDQICEGLLKRTILVMFQWKEGSFAFESDEKVDFWKNFRLEGYRHVFAKGLSPQYLALEGARLEDERREGLGGPQDKIAQALLASQASQAAQAPDVASLASLVRPLLEDTLSDFEDDAAPPSWHEDTQVSTMVPEHLFDPRRELSESDSLRASQIQVKAASSIEGEMATLRSMLAELKEAQSRDAVALLVLRFAGLLLERAAMFIPDGDVMAGFGGFCSVQLPGHSDTPLNYMMQVRRVKIAQSDDTILRQVQLSRMLMSLPLAMTEANRDLVGALGGPWHSQKVVAAPLIAAEEVVLILFGDNPSGKPIGETDGLEIFLQQAGIAMERVAAKR